MSGRPIDREEAQPIPGTEGATAPVVSPDGQAVAFYANGAIRRVRLADGPVTTLAEPVPVAPARIAWTRAGGVIFDAPPAGGRWQCDGSSETSEHTKDRTDWSDLPTSHLD